jgi:hypothetical protein
MRSNKDHDEEYKRINEHHYQEHKTINKNYEKEYNLRLIDTAIRIFTLTAPNTAVYRPYRSTWEEIKLRQFKHKRNV